jgi:hypothetical protein
VWSAFFGLPLVAAGGYLVRFRAGTPAAVDRSIPLAVVGAALVVFGLLVVGGGVYVRFARVPERPETEDGEWIVAEREPARRSSLAKAVTAVPFLVGGVWLVSIPERGFVYGTVALAGGLSLLSAGLYRYWRNTLATYLVTNRRLIEQCRDRSPGRVDLRFEEVRSVEERRSVWDEPFGLGSISVRAVGADDRTITIRSISKSATFAETIRDRVGRARGEGRRTHRVDSSEGTTATDATDATGHRAGDDTRPDSDEVIVDVGGGGGELPSEPPTGLTGLPRRGQQPPERESVSTGEQSVDE